eukprot:67833-Rhodomonas_salina.1
MATVMSDLVKISNFEPRVDFVLDGNSSQDTDFHWQTGESSCSWQHNLQGEPAFSHFEAILLESLHSADELDSHTQISWIEKSTTQNIYVQPWDRRVVAGPVRISKNASSAFVDGLSLQHGRKYFWVLLVCSNSRLCTAAISDGFVVETDSPNVGCVSIGDVHSSQTTPATEYVYVSSAASISLAWIATSGSNNHDLLAFCDDGEPERLSGFVQNTSSYIKTARLAILPIDRLRNESRDSSSTDHFIVLDDVSNMRPSDHRCCNVIVPTIKKYDQLLHQDIGSLTYNVLASIGDNMLVISTESAIFLMNARTKHRHFVSQNRIPDATIAVSENYFAFESPEGLSVFKVGAAGVHGVGENLPEASLMECYGLTSAGQILAVSSIRDTLTVYELSEAAWKLQDQYSLPASIDAGCAVRAVASTLWLVRSTFQSWTIFTLDQTGVHTVGTLTVTSVTSLAVIQVDESGIIAVGDPHKDDGSGVVDIHLVRGLDKNGMSLVCTISGGHHQLLGATIALSHGDLPNTGTVMMAALVENAPHAVIVYEIEAFSNSCSMIGTIEPPADHSKLSTDFFLLGNSVVLRGDEQSTSPYLFYTVCGKTSVAVYSPGAQLGVCSACPRSEVAVHENGDFCQSCSGILCQDQIAFKATMELSTPLVAEQWYRADLAVFNRAGARAVASSVSFAWDFSPPVVGILEDRAVPINTTINQTEDTGDVDFVSQNMSLLGVWRSFADPESGISRFNVSLGTRPGKDDVYAWRRLPPSASHTVFPSVPWKHGITFYINLECCNGALPEACILVSSDGIALDTTAPVMSFVYDGFVEGSDWTQQTFADALFASWEGQEDVGKIAEYEWSVWDSSSNTTLVDWRSVGTATLYGVWDIELPRGFRGISCVRAINEAGLRSEVRCSNGISLGKMEQLVSADRATQIAFSLSSIRNESSTGSEISYSQISIPPNTVEDGFSILVGQLDGEEYADAELENPKLANLTLLPNMKIGNYSFVATVLDQYQQSVRNFKFVSPVTLSFVLDRDAMLQVSPADDISTIAPALLLRNTTSGQWINALQTCAQSQLASQARWEFDRDNIVFTARICHFTQFAIAYQASPIAMVRAADLNLSHNQNQTELQANAIDPDGIVISFHWMLKSVEPSDPNSTRLVVIQEPAAASTSVSGLLPLHRYEFRLTVEDNDFATDQTSVWIAVIGPTMILSAVSLPSTIPVELIFDPQPMLHALDAEHHLNMFQSDQVTISVLILPNHTADSTSGTDVLTGTTMAHMVKGVAQFSDLRFTAAGEYVLLFHAIESNVSTTTSIVVLAACLAGKTPKDL